MATKHKQRQNGQKKQAKKDRKRSVPLLSSSSTSEDEEEIPLSRWKVSIKSSEKKATSTTDTSAGSQAERNDRNGRNSHVSKKPEKAETEDLRLFLSRKRPRMEDDSSTDDQEPSHKAVRTTLEPG